MIQPTGEDELFLDVLEDNRGNVEKTRVVLDLTRAQCSYRFKKLKEVIQERTRDRLTQASLQAVCTMEELLNADADTDQGSLRLKASSEILDRSGITKHTNIDVSVETENGIFILPAKEK